MVFPECFYIIPAEPVCIGFILKPEEVILFGNNNYEDGDCASSLGIKTYLVKGYIIYNPKAKGTYEEIEMKDIIPTIEKEKEQRK
jgi:hypothetical protein